MLDEIIAQCPRDLGFNEPDIIAPVDETRCVFAAKSVTNHKKARERYVMGLDRCAKAHESENADLWFVVLNPAPLIDLQERRNSTWHATEHSNQDGLASH